MKITKRLEKHELTKEENVKKVQSAALYIVIFGTNLKAVIFNSRKYYGGKARRESFGIYHLVNYNELITKETTQTRLQSKILI